MAQIEQNQDCRDTEPIIPQAIRVTVYKGNNLPNVSCELLHSLRETYVEVSKDYDFPVLCCGYTTSIVWSNTGMKYVHGTFIPDLFDEMLDENPYMKEGKSNHTWSVDLEGRIYDLTATQFNRYMLEPIPQGVIIAEPGSDFYRRFQPKA